ncbi:hypothetical protein HNQ36_005024 [Afipia massiliensis]|uniref:Uncharacterized protein n=1 Tax=Afipia massiliensis TaxID=211460 RepID=A0A840N4N2_9BRAD|nr:hypothetical protein [Afipia massiliensis]
MHKGTREQREPKQRAQKMGSVLHPKIRTSDGEQNQQRQASRRCEESSFRRSIAVGVTAGLHPDSCRWIFSQSQSEQQPTQTL